ncbi:MAG: ABC transporter permease [Rhodospirillales bacterium]|nr:ABC transporter permease [Rhodospirillales bacterium]
MSTVIETAVVKPAPVSTPFRQFVSRFAESRAALAGLVIFVTILILAIAAPLIAPTDPYDLTKVDIIDNRLPPGSQSLDGTTYWLGTDGLGRDMVSAMLYGIRISLFVAVSSGVVALLIGMVLGLSAAYFGGIVDTLIMRLVDLKLGFPSVLLALLLLAALGKGVDKIIIAIVVVQWATYARVVRAGALVERSKEYVDAAQGLALGHMRVLFRHLLPNALPPLIVVGTVQIANAIALESTLSFLGLGLPPTEPSLGLLIANGFDYMLSGKYWISIYPGIVLLVTILSINLMGDQVRDVLNPRLQK